MPSSRDTTTQLEEAVKATMQLAGELQGKLLLLETLRESVTDIKGKIDQLHRAFYEGNGKESYTVRMSRAEDKLKLHDDKLKTCTDGCARLRLVEESVEERKENFKAVHLVIASSVISALVTGLLGGLGWMILRAFGAGQ